jgi:hypothetical protein
MKIEQDKQAIASRSFDVVKDLLGLEHRLVRLVGGIKRLETFGDGPTKGFEIEFAGELANEGDDLRFFVAFDGNQRGARADNRSQVAKGALRGKRCGLREAGRLKTHFSAPLYTARRDIARMLNPMRQGNARYLS